MQRLRYARWPPSRSVRDYEDRSHGRTTETEGEGLREEERVRERGPRRAREKKSEERARGEGV